MYNYQEIKGLLEDMSTEMKALVDKVRVQLWTAWSAAAMHICAMEGSAPCVEWQIAICIMLAWHATFVQASICDALLRLQEIQHAYHTNALLVKILLNQAQANGLQFHVDTNALENEFLLKTIMTSETTALSRYLSEHHRA